VSGCALSNERSWPITPILSTAANDGYYAVNCHKLVFDMDPVKLVEPGAIGPV
jgi:hypothetical protein